MDFRKLFFVCCLPLTMSGCVAAAIAAGVGLGVAGKNIVDDHRGVKQVFSDRKITDKIVTQLAHNPWVQRNSHISVTAYNGVVLLAGQTQSQDVKQFVGNVAHQTPGVRKVYNELVISGTQGTLSSVNDDWLATKVRSAMVGRKGLYTNNIKVIAVDGIVYLMGDVSAEQAQLAANTARRVSGVRKVVEVFEHSATSQS